MKAVLYQNKNKPIFKVSEINCPKPKKNQVLIEVKASSLDISDYERFKQGKQSLLGWFGNLTGSKNKPLGYEVSGVVKEIGTASISHFHKGDEVFGYTCSGGWGQYALMNVTQTMLKPANLSYEEAAILPNGSQTSLGAIKVGKITKGQDVLVYGASGSVGHLLVQYVKATGAKVTGVCSSKNVSLLQSLGCDDVIDYQKDNFDKSAQHYDVIIAVNGAIPIKQLVNHLKRNGIIVAIGAHYLFKVLLQSFFSKKLAFYSGFLHSRNAFLSEVQKIVNSGKIKPFVDKVYPVTKIEEAIHYVSTAHAQGKVAITIDL